MTPVCYCPECEPERDGEGVEELWRIECHVRYVDASRILEMPRERRLAELDRHAREHGAHAAKLLELEVMRQFNERLKKRRGNPS